MMNPVIRIKNTRASIRLLFFVVALLSALPITPYLLNGFFVWFSPYLMLNSVLATKVWVWFQLIALFILIGCIFYKRLFCRYLCPTGFIFDTVSLITRKKSCLTTRKIPKMSIWLAVFALFSALAGIPIYAFLDPVVAFYSFSSALSYPMRLLYIVTSSLLPLFIIIQFILPGLWCNKICPCGGIQDLAYRLKKVKRQVPNHSATRRLILAGGAGLLTGLCIPKLWSSPTPKRLKPPSAIDDTDYPFVCVRCGNCINACPSKIIKRYHTTNDIRLWLTPEIDFTSGYCIETCTNCGIVCPSGALTPFSQKEKKKLVIGKAKIDIRNCLLQDQRECDQCIRLCTYKAIHITNKGSIFNVYPEISRDKCVGCGICANICPEQCFTIISVN